MTQTQAPKSPTRTAAQAEEAAARSAAIAAGTEDLLDEIDAVIEENGVLTDYRQRGGE